MSFHHLGYVLKIRPDVTVAFGGELTQTHIVCLCKSNFFYSAFEAPYWKPSQEKKFDKDGVPIYNLTFSRDFSVKIWDTVLQHMYCVDKESETKDECPICDDSQSLSFDLECYAMCDELDWKEGKSHFFSLIDVDLSREVITIPEFLKAMEFALLYHGLTSMRERVFNEFSFLKNVDLNWLRQNLQFDNVAIKFYNRIVSMALFFPNLQLLEEREKIKGLLSCHYFPITAKGYYGVCMQREIDDHLDPFRLFSVCFSRKDIVPVENETKCTRLTQSFTFDINVLVNKTDLQIIASFSEKVDSRIQAIIVSFLDSENLNVLFIDPKKGSIKTIKDCSTWKGEFSMSYKRKEKNENEQKKTIKLTNVNFRDTISVLFLIRNSKGVDWKQAYKTWLCDNYSVEYRSLTEEI